MAALMPVSGSQADPKMTKARSATVLLPGVVEASGTVWARSSSTAAFSRVSGSGVRHPEADWLLGVNCTWNARQDPSTVTVAQVRFTNGDKFEGQYSGNRKHGFGTYAWADGAVEEGQWLFRIAGSAEVTLGSMRGTLLLVCYTMVYYSI